MKKYGNYQSVSSLWVHSIPTHWEFNKLRSVFWQRKEKNEPVKTKEILSLSAKAGVELYSQKTQGGGNKAKDDITKYNIACEGDLIVNCMNVISGSVGLSKYYGAISPVYYALVTRNENFNKFYYEYLFKIEPFQKSLLPLGRGILMHESSTGKLNTIRLRISMADFNNVYLPVPPKDEQDQIVRYLDWKVSNINRLIHGYQRQIDLLEERKRSFAFNAVTQGLHANSTKTESPLYWLESIPAHWDTNSIAQLFTEVKNKNKGMQENNLLSLSYGTIKRRNIDATEGLLPASFEGYNIIEKDDIVLRLTDLQNDHKSLRTGIATERGIITSAYLTIRNKSDNNPEFLQLFLHAFDLAKGFYNVGASGVRQSLNWDTVKMLKVLIPPIPEQNQIVEAIKAEYEKIGTAIESVKQQIEFLREYRTRLISDVVTGQVDVRGVEIPDYTPEEDNAVYDENNDTEEVTDSAD